MKYMRAYMHVPPMGRVYMWLMPLLRVAYAPWPFFVQVIDNQVVLVRTRRKEGYYALQIGAIDHPKLKNVCWFASYDLLWTSSTLDP